MSSIEIGAVAELIQNGKTLKNFEWKAPTFQVLKTIIQGTSSGHYFERGMVNIYERILFCLSELLENAFHGSGYACKPGSDFTVFFVELMNKWLYMVTMSEASPAKSWEENTIKCQMPFKGNREKMGDGTGTYQDGMGYTESNLVTDSPDELDSYMLSLKHPVDTVEQFLDVDSWNVSVKNKVTGQPQLVYSLSAAKELFDGMQTEYIDQNGKERTIFADLSVVREIFHIFKSVEKFYYEGGKKIDRYSDFNFLGKKVIRISRIYKSCGLDNFNFSHLYSNALGILTDLSSPVMNKGKKTQKRIRIFNEVMYHGKALNGNHCDHPYSYDFLLNPTEYVSRSGAQKNPYAFFQKDRFSFSLKNVVFSEGNEEENIDPALMDVDVVIMAKTDYFMGIGTTALQNIGYKNSGGRIIIPAKGGRYTKTASHLMSRLQCDNFIEEILNSRKDEKEGIFSIFNRMFVDISINSLKKLNPTTGVWENTPDRIHTQTDFQLSDADRAKVEVLILNKISKHIATSTEEDIVLRRQGLIDFLYQNYWKEDDGEFKVIGAYARTPKVLDEYSWYDAKTGEVIEDGSIAPKENEETIVYAVLKYEEELVEQLVPYWEHASLYDNGSEFLYCHMLGVQLATPYEKIKNGISPLYENKPVLKIVIPPLSKITNYDECKSDTVNVSPVSTVKMLIEPLSLKEYQDSPGYCAYFPKRVNCFKKGTSEVYFPNLNVPYPKRAPSTQTTTSSTENDGNQKPRGIANYYASFNETCDHPVQKCMFARIRKDRVELNSDDEIKFLYTRQFNDNKDIDKETNRMYQTVDGIFKDFCSYELRHGGTKFGIERIHRNDPDYEIEEDNILNAKLNQIWGIVLTELVDRCNGTALGKAIGQEKIDKIAKRAKELKNWFQS